MTATGRSTTGPSTLLTPDPVSTAHPGDAVKALVAAGTSPAGRRTVDGELVWVPLPCGRPACSCILDFEGVVTRGITDIAQVRTFPGVDRAALRRAIADGMCPDCVPRSVAPGRADWLLHVAADLPDGMLVRRHRFGGFLPVDPTER
jgi:hypothetical protein